MKWLIFAAIGQWLACVLLATGIVVEIVARADIGYIAITVGSILFAGITKAEYHGRRWFDHLNSNKRDS